MADIGRLDVAHSLKKALDLTGSYSPELGEGIVPTVRLLDLENSPYALAVAFQAGAVQPLVAMQFAGVILEPTLDLPARAIVTIDAMYFASDVVQDILIGALGADEIPGGIFAIQTPILRRQAPGVPGSRQHGEIGGIICRRGTSPGSPTQGTVIRLGTTGSVPVTGPWHVGFGGTFQIHAASPGTALIVTILGRVHYTSAR